MSKPRCRKTLFFSIQLLSKTDSFFRIDYGGFLASKSRVEKSIRKTLIFHIAKD